MRRKQLQLFGSFSTNICCVDNYHLFQDIWKGILSVDIVDDTDFFKSGAGSMDIARLVEEVRHKTNITIENSEVIFTDDVDEIWVFHSEFSE